MSTETEVTLQILADDKILINGAQNETLYTDCGPNNRTLNGNFLLTVRNCTLSFENETLKFTETYSKAEEIQNSCTELT